MRPTNGLVTALRHDKIESARQASPDQKLRAGPELFDLACEAAKSGIRAQHPNADEQEVQRLLRHRVERQPHSDMMK